MVLPLGERQNIAHCKKIKVDGYGYARVYAQPLFPPFFAYGKVPARCRFIFLPREKYLPAQENKFIWAWP